MVGPNTDAVSNYPSGGSEHELFFSRRVTAIFFPTVLHTSLPFHSHPFPNAKKIPRHKYSPVEAWRSTSFPLTRYWYSKWDPPPSKVQIVGNSQHTGSIICSRHPTTSHCNNYPAPRYSPLFNTNHDAGARLCHPVPAILI